MKTLSRRFLGFLIIISLFISIAPTAFAEGTTMIDLSNKSPAVGDKITMTVTGSDSSTITVKYNASVLNFSSCNVSGYTADGNTVTFSGASGSIEFVASAAGTSNLIVSSDALTGSSTTLNVAGDSSSSDSSEEESSAQTNTSESGEETGADSETTGSSASSENYDFMYGDTAYVISKRFTDSQIPAGFESTTITIHESEYKAVSNGSMTLLYLKKASDTYGEGEFFVYDVESDSVSEFLMIGSKDDYVILATPDTLPSDQLTDVPYSGEAGDFTAYQFSGINNDFYYIYGVDENGTAGWFLFDAAEQSVSRANVDAFALIGSVQSDSTEVVSEEPTETAEDSILSKLNMRNVVAVLILVLAVIVVILINVAVSKSRSDEDFEEEDDDDDDENSNQKSLKDIVKEADASTISSEDGYEEDDEDEEDDEPRGFFFRRRKKEEDIWADDESDDSDDSDEDEVNDKEDDNNHPGDSGNSNHEINLMDLNNL